MSLAAAVDMPPDGRLLDVNNKSITNSHYVSRDTAALVEFCDDLNFEFQNHELRV